MSKTITKPVPIRERIRAANTDLIESQTLHQRLMAYSQTARAATVENVDEQYRARLLAGEDPVDLVDDYIAAKNRETAAVQFGRVVAGILQSTLDTSVHETAFVDHALDMCRTELEQIMSRVDEHRDLIKSHPETADAAIRHGSLDDYQTVEQILTDYDQLIAEYRRQIRLGNPSLGGQLIDSVQCRDFLDVSTYWLHQRRTTSVLEDYPDPTIRGWFRGLPAPSSRTRAEQILTIADHGPWMPDPDTLAAVTRIAEQLCRHRWNTGTIGQDRTIFAGHLAQLRHLTHDEPIPEQKPAARRLA